MKPTLIVRALLLAGAVCLAGCGGGGGGTAAPPVANPPPVVVPPVVPPVQAAVTFTNVAVHGAREPAADYFLALYEEPVVPA